MEYKDTNGITLKEGDIVEFEVVSGNTTRCWQGEVVSYEGDLEVYVPGDGVYALSEGYTKIGSKTNGDYAIN